MKKLDGIYRRVHQRQRPIDHRSGPKQMATILIVTVIVASLIWSARPVGAVVDLAQLIQDGRYMVAFQNNTELRPSGGFLGSFAIIDIENHQLKRYWFETNIYKTDNEFSKRMMIPPPKPLAESWPGRSWALNSSNWAVDFFEAASSMRWFYELEYQDTLDGVIAINATTVMNLLQIIGPIPLPEHGMTVTADNFLKAIQWEVEKAYFEDPDHLVENEPKTILKDLMAVILKRIKQSQGPGDLWRFVEQSFETKDVQVAFFDYPAAQAIAEKRNWAGRIWGNAPTDHYLSINNANLHGGKGSLGVRQKVRYESSTNNSGDTEVTVTITRINAGRSDGWEVGENRNFTRVLVPLGAKLLDVRFEGEPIEDVRVEIESGKTSFGFWFTTPLHKQRTTTIRYHLPLVSSPCLVALMCKKAPFSLTVQKQSGSPADELIVYQDSTLKTRQLVDRDLVIH